MSDLAKKGRELFEDGYSCSESTWLALNQDLPREELDFGLKLAGGFSGGFCSGKVCGAISGAVMALGRHYGRIMGEERNEVLKEKVQMLMEYVEGEYGSDMCHEMRPDEDYRPFCAQLVEDLIKYTEQELID